MTRIGIIRHGSTAWNKEGRAQGSSDIPLDEAGLAEAMLLAERLGEEKWDAVYSSHLLRAKQTAEAIGNKFGWEEVLLEPRLREVGGGQIEGTTEDERIAKWGKSWRELDLGIEPSDRVVERGLSFFQDVEENHPGQDVLLVSHGSFIRHMLKELVPHLDMEASPKNTSLTILSRGSDGWEVELYNCVKHLDQPDRNKE